MPEPEDRPEIQRSVVELVVVHGMGRQKPSDTLLEWSEALLRRIDWIATGGDSENPGAASGAASARASAAALEAARALAQRESADAAEEAYAQNESHDSSGPCEGDHPSDDDVLAELRELMQSEGIARIEVSGLVLGILEDDPAGETMRLEPAVPTPQTLSSPPTLSSPQTLSSLQTPASPPTLPSPVAASTGPISASASMMAHASPVGRVRRAAHAASPAEPPLFSAGSAGEAPPASPVSPVSQVSPVEAPAAAQGPATPVPGARGPGGSSTDDPEPRPTAIEYGEVVLSEQGPDAVNVTIGYADSTGKLHALSLRITEARWSETVPPMTRGQVFSWGLRFVRRTIWRAARHFGNVWWTPVQGTRRVFAKIVAAIAWVLTWALSGAVWLVLSIFLIVAGPLLIFPFVKNLAQAAIDTLIDFVGDAAVWGVRPIRAAGMRDLVRSRIRDADRNLDLARTQMSGDVPTSLVVLAHSQGAAISADALFSLTNGEERIPVDALVTVGAAVTLLGSSSWTLDRQARLAAAASDGPPRNRVRAWAQSRSRSGAKPTRWLNFWGIWDPIPAGPISTGDAARASRWQASYASRSTTRATNAQWGPEENPVHNTASPLADHQSYASNVTQVLDPIARLLMRLEDDNPAGRPAARQRVELHIRAIKALGLNRVLVLLAVVLGFLVDLRGSAAVADDAQTPRDAGPFDLARRVLAFLFSTDADKGVFAWVFAIDWLPRALVLVPLAIAALVLNESLSRRYHESIDWARPDAHLSSSWRSGAVLRFVVGAVIVAELVLLTAAGVTDATSLGWGAAALAAGGLVLVVVVLVPSLYDPRWGHLPSTVTQNPPSGPPVTIPGRPPSR